MKLTSIELHPDGSADDPVIFSFRDPQSLNPYLIKSIGGLDLEQIVPRYYGGDEQSKLYSLAITKRVVILQMGLNPNFATSESYSDLRDAIYRTIAASRTGLIQLQFKYNDIVVAVLSGSATKVEADLFQNSLEILMTLECKDPMLKSPNPVIFDINELSPAATSLEDNRSTAPHGFSFVLGFQAAVSTLSITNEDLGFTFTIRPRDSFVAGDHLYFSSDFLNRYLYFTRGSNTHHLADVIDFNSIWPVIFPGINSIQVSSASVIWEEISHYETYWGV